MVYLCHLLQIEAPSSSRKFEKICTNMTFGVESSRSRSYVTTTNHDFTSSGLTSITVLGSFSSTLLSRRRSVLLHLCHRVGDMSTYKLERYSVGRVLGMIQNDKGE